MAQIEERVIRIVGDTSQLEPTIQKLKSLGVIVEQDEKKFKTANDKMQKELAQTGRAAQKVGTQSQKAAKQASTSFDGLSKRVAQLGSAFVGAFAFQQVVTNAVNTLKKFESALDNLSAITGATGKDLEFLRDKAIEFSRTTTIGAIEAVEAFKLMASAKPELLESAEALAKVTEEAILLSEASGQDLPAAITNLGNTLNAMELDASEAGRVVNVLAAASQKGAKEVPFITQALSKFGGVAANAGESIETSAAAIEILGAKIPQAETVGVGLRNVLLELQTAAQAQGREFMGLSKELELLSPRINDITFLEKSFGKENILVAQTLIRQRDKLDELTDAITGTNIAMEQAVVNTDNFEGSVDRLGNAWDGLILQMSGSDGALTGTAEIFTVLLEAFNGTEDAAHDLQDQFGLSNRELGRLLSTHGTYGAVINELKGRLNDLNLEQGEFGATVKTNLAPTLELTEVLERWLEVQAKINGTFVEATEAEKEQAKTIGELKKELKELRKAQNDLVPGSKELAENQNRVKEVLATLKGEVVKTLSPLEILSKRISTLKKELDEQAFAGNVSTETLKEYKSALRQAAIAEEKLNKALEDSLGLLPIMNTELNKLFVRDVPFIENTTALEDFFSKYQDEIAAAIEAEQRLFSIVSQINTNKLINIDNETTLQLRALEEQGLGEEELAKRRLDIQIKSDEERAKILTKQAKADKLARIFEATINTAVGVTAALRLGPAGIPLAIVIGGLGAIEIAAIAAQPIPVFHEGKKSELKDGEMYAKILKTETVIPPEQSKKHKGLLDAVIDKNLDAYVMKQYTLPMIMNMTKEKGNSPYNDVHLWSNQKKQINLSQETNSLLRTMTKAMNSGSSRRSWS